MPTHGSFPLLPRLPRGLLRLPVCKVLTDLPPNHPGALNTGPSKDGGLGYLETLSFSGQVHGGNAHPCLAGLMVQVSAKTSMKSIQGNRQSLRFTGSGGERYSCFFSPAWTVLESPSSHPSVLTPVPGKSVHQLNIHTTIWIPHQNALAMV